MQKDVRTSQITCTSFGKDTYHCSLLEFGHISMDTSGCPYIFLHTPPAGLPYAGVVDDLELENPTRFINLN